MEICKNAKFACPTAHIWRQFADSIACQLPVNWATIYLTLQCKTTKIQEIKHITERQASPHTRMAQLKNLPKEILPSAKFSLFRSSQVVPSHMYLASRDCSAVVSKVMNVMVTDKSTKNIARIANAVPVTLYSRITVNVEIVVLNCQKCNQCLKCHKSFGLVFEGVL